MSYGQSSNAYASGSNQNSGNVITDRSTTRLHAPPGGNSSFSLGQDYPPEPSRGQNQAMGQQQGQGYGQQQQQPR
eukprot:CAMPEP_0185754090 /NCGR_PEP_ID=MMETSP1174-20130828/12750_1 /TAXON_ID=35687 /ORGANISM="Dictyocha speculum, Strain CCMP1381" /LENGTH=74 /DNA_ID=CAMNT_0028432167 /DNA_START=21 /DNA_END=241 /DNA_ORIENTATION=+